MPSFPAVPLLSIAIAFGLVFANAFFVAAEFSIVKVRRTRLEELSGQGNRAARASILLVDQLDEYLSATQLGITLVSLALGWIGEEAFAALLIGLWPEQFAAGTGPLHLVAVGVSFLIITMLHVVLGELVPKSMAIQQAERLTLIIARPLRIFHKFARPMIHAFTWMANLVLRRIGYHGLEEPPLSENELKIVMQESHEEGVISESEAQIINRAFEFSDKRASDIMISADKAQVLSLAHSVERNLEIVRERMHTRFPLCRGQGLDSLIGIVHMKDAWPKLAEQRANASIEKAARPAIFVDGGLKQDQLMKVFKAKRGHMAIVRDQAGARNIGIVTMEDILEELVGEIVDEHGN